MSNTDNTSKNTFSLTSDNGSALSFNGRLMVDKEYFDIDTSNLTRLRLFVTDEGHMVYSVIAGPANNRSRRAYTIATEGDICRISDGVVSLQLPINTLLSTAFDICGIDPQASEDFRPAFEEVLRAANS